MTIPHDHHRDDTQTEIGPDGVRSVSGDPFEITSTLEPCIIVVSGPDGDNEILIMAAGECYLSREAAGKLRDELTRRLEGK
jgi:hypothetical protein